MPLGCARGDGLRTAKRIQSLLDGEQRHRLDLRSPPPPTARQAIIAKE
jgi:hypothetical protein